MVALRTWLSTHERVDTHLHGRSSRVVLLFEKLLELILSTTKLYLPRERVEILFHGTGARVVLLFEKLPELILGTTKLCLTLLALLLLLLFLHELRLSTNKCGNLTFRGRCSRVVFICEAILELILGTTKLCLKLLPPPPPPASSAPPRTSAGHS